MRNGLMQSGLTLVLTQELTRTLANCMMTAAAIAFLCAGSTAWAQKYTPPRTPWDSSHPDLSGIWQAKLAVGDDIEKSIVDPPNKKIPYLPAAAATVKANAANKAKLDTMAKCYMPGVPRMMYMNYPFQIFQTPKYIPIVSEYSHTYRVIYMDGSEHAGYIPLWLGDSRGHWDGDTLVVDVLSFNDQTWFDKAGNVHSDQLHVVERYTRTSADTMTYEATISDPKVFSKDWKISVPLTLNKKPNARLMEYECQELAPPVE
jgi:hypothetical protein